MAQMGFFDLSDRYASLNAKRDPLVEIDALVPCEEFRPLLTSAWRKPPGDRKSRSDRESWDVVTIFKTLVLRRALQPFGRPDRVPDPGPAVLHELSRSGAQDRLPDAKAV